MLTLSPQPKIWGFHVVVLWRTAKKRTEIRAPRAARVSKFSFSTNHILALWRYRCCSRRLCIIGSLRNDDGYGNDNAKKQ